MIESYNKNLQLGQFNTEINNIDIAAINSCDTDDLSISLLLNSESDTTNQIPCSKII